MSIQTRIPFQKPDKINKKLYVITAIINQVRFLSRWNTYFAFEKHVIDSGAVLVTVEYAFGEREFVIKEPYNENHIIVQRRTSSEIWTKENAMNLGMQYLPPDWEYVCFSDADFHFLDPNWVDNCLHKLQHYPVIQMFNQVTYLGPYGQVINTRMSFASRWLHGLDFSSHGKKISNKIFEKPRAFLPAVDLAYRDQQYQNEGGKASDDWGPPGGAWAYRRKELEEVGGNIDFCILGSADWYQAAGIIGFMEQAIPPEYGAEFRRQLLNWQDIALKAWRKNMGVMEQTAVHYFHGSFKDRRYGKREVILKDNWYNPLTDVKYSTQGVIILHDDGSERMRLLRDQCRPIFHVRNEDDLSM